MKCHVLLITCNEDLCKVFHHSFKDHYCQGARSNLLLVTFRTQPLYCHCRNFHVCFLSQNSLIASGSLVLKSKALLYTNSSADYQGKDFCISFWKLKTKQMVCHALWARHTGTLINSLQKAKKSKGYNAHNDVGQCNIKHKGMQPCRIICCI